ncbi:MAG: nucleotide exchange factor GrpE [Clostridia bacterium]|nr:nucleotide exchange factor GrpE [Clostridia bacterium]
MEEEKDVKAKEEEIPTPEEETTEAAQADPEAPAEDVKEEKEEKSKSRDEKKYKSKAAALEKENGELKAKIDEMQEKYLRIAAEYDNFRKRSQKEKEGIYSDAVSDTVSELLPLFDNLDRASEYVGGENVGEGLALIIKAVPDVLTKLKIEAFGEVGDKFDPNIHEAMMHEESEEHGESEITAVFRKGYRIGEKIIRHALVKVAN